MKTRILTLLLITGCTFFNSCDINNDEATPPPLDNLIEVWNLKHVLGGFSDTDLDYNLGDVIWIFNATESTLRVYNTIDNTGPEDIYAGLDTGVYDFIIKKEGEDQILYVDDRSFGVIVVSSDGTLTIDNGLASDGYVSTFKRSKILNGSFTGSFKRDGVSADVTLNLSNNTFTGSSVKEKFPAICKGVYTVSETSIYFVDECSWTEDFDYSLILSGSWDYDLPPDNGFNMIKSNGDQYILYFN